MPGVHIDVRGGVYAPYVQARKARQMLVTTEAVGERVPTCERADVPPLVGRLSDGIGVNDRGHRARAWSGEMGVPCLRTYPPSWRGDGCRGQSSVFDDGESRSRYRGSNGRSRPGDAIRLGKYSGNNGLAASARVVIRLQPEPSLACSSALVIVSSLCFQPSRSHSRSRHSPADAAGLCEQREAQNVRVEFRGQHRSELALNGEARRRGTS